MLGKRSLVHRMSHGRLWPGPRHLCMLLAACALLAAPAVVSAQTMAMSGSPALDTTVKYTGRYRNPADSVEVNRLLENAYALPRIHRDSALKMAWQALHLAQRSVVDSMHMDVAHTWHWVGRHSLNLGMYEEAGHAFAQQLAMTERLVGNDHPARSEALDYIARALRGTGRTAESIPYYRQSLALRRRYFGSTPNADFAGSMNNLGLALVRAGAYDEADTLYREAMAMHRQLYKGDHMDLATTINNRGVLLLERGRIAEATAVLEEGVAMLRRVITEGNQDPVLPAGIAALARAYRTAGRYDTALAMARDVLRRRLMIYKGDHPGLASANADMGRLLWQTGSREEGLKLLRESAAMYQRLFPDGHPAYASTMVELGTVLREDGSLADADTVLRKAVAMRRKAQEESHIGLAAALIEHARVYVRFGKHDEAAQLLKEAAPLVGSIDHPTSVLLSRARAELAEARGGSKEAAQEYRTAVAMLGRMFPAGHPDRREILLQLASSLERGGSKAEAAEARKQAQSEPPGK